MTSRYLLWCGRILLGNSCFPLFGIIMMLSVCSLGEQYDLQKAEILVAVTYIKEHGMQVNCIL